MGRSRTARSLKRRGPIREPYDFVLIVCEGEKTEPNYFRALVRDLRLSSANVVVTGDGGSAPQSVVAYAIERFAANPTYDAVFCVFDKDGHARYDEARITIRDHRLRRFENGMAAGSARFEAITSVPCFEFWLLLHVRFTTAPMRRCSNVQKAMKSEALFQSYEKGAQGWYERTHGLLGQALTNADRANNAAAAAQTDDPTTLVPTLVRYLQDLGK